MKRGMMNAVFIDRWAMWLVAIALTGCSQGGENTGTSVSPPPSPPPTVELSVTLASGTNSGTGTVSSNPAGVTCTPNPNPTSCAGVFPQGETVVLTATPTATHAFAGWTLGGCSGVGTCTVVLNAATATTATFNGPITTPMVSIAVTGSGATGSSVTSDVGGIVCPGSCSSTGLTNATPVTLTATAAPGSFFQGWTGAPCTGPASPCTFTPSADTLITATFIKPTISLTVTGSGSVSSAPAGINTCTSAAPCSAQFNYNSSVTLTATIPVGSAFTGWSFVGTPTAGTCTGTTNPCTITPLTADVAVTAAIAPLVATPTVTVSFVNSNGGTGTVSSAGGTTNFTNCSAASCVATYVSGGAASISATAATGSVFTGWTAGPCSGTTTSPCAVNPILANQTMTASFTRPLLTVTMVGTGTVSSSGSVTGANTNCTGSCTRAFNSGETVTLTASSTAGFVFQGWTGGLGTCTGGATGSCSFLMPVGGAAVTATFNSQVSAVQNFKFIGAAGRELLAINPASPGTPTLVQVGGVNVILPIFTGGNGSAAADQIRSGTYSVGTTSFTNIQRNTLIFASGGKIYKASTLVSNGVPGVAGTNVPQQVSSMTTARFCGMGSLRDIGNSNPVIGFLDAGADNSCDTGDDFLVLMHLNDGAGTAPLILPVGTEINDGEVYNLATGALTKVIIATGTGNLQTIDNTLAAPVNIIGGTGIGAVNTVGLQSDKVFVASSTKLYIYTPSTNTLSAAVVTADAGQTWMNFGDVQVLADSTAIYLVQTNADVFRVPLTTTSGQTVGTKHFDAGAGTIASRAVQTPNRVIILLGTDPRDNNPCVASNTCNNGIIAVNKTVSGLADEIEAPVPANQIFTISPFNSHVLYNLNNPPGGVFGGFARIEDASAPRIDRTGFWSEGILNPTFNAVSLQQSVLRALSVESTGLANGSVVKAFSSPTTLSPVTLGTVSDPSNLLQFAPFFRRSIDNASIGFANLLANPLFKQPFFVDTTLNSLTKITTPGSPAHWEEIEGD